MNDELPRRYTIRSRLGGDDRNRAYRVFDEMLGEEVVLKVFGGLGDDDQRARFVRDVRMVRRLTHPNVIRIFDVATHGESTFVTMELVEGSHLGALGQLEEREAIRIATGIADALHAAHGRGITHGALRPTNVLVGGDGRVVVTDFCVGSKSPRYTAPELREGGEEEGGPMTPPADLFSLGVLLYEMISGARESSSHEVDSGAVTPPHEHEAALRRELAELVKRLLAGQPARRPTATSAAQRLRHLGAQLDTISRELVLEPVGESHGPRLSILDFRYQGPPSHSHLRGAFAGRLLEVLATTEGLRVAGPGQVDEGDDLLVSGTIQVAAPRVRITLRLAKPNGTQIWSTHVDGLLEGDALEAGMVRRLAESVRLQASALSIEEVVSSAAVALYLEADKLMRAGSADLAEVVSLLEQANSEAGGVPVILGKRALALVRAERWTDECTEDEASGHDYVFEALTAARVLASSCADTFLADAEWHLMQGSLQATLRGYSKAIELAPTSAFAHHRLARTQMRAGRTGVARQRLEHAAMLDPELVEVQLTQVRMAAFAGDDATADALLGRVASRVGRSHPAVLMTQIRLGLWTGRLGLVEDATRWLGDGAAHQRLRAIADAATRRNANVDVLLPKVARYAGVRAEMSTLLAELWLVREEFDEAVSVLRATADALVDLDWLTRCPANVPLRERNDYRQLVGAVRAIVQVSIEDVRTRSRVTL